MSEPDQQSHMPQPTAEHHDLLKSVGTWDVKGRMFMGGPDTEPVATAAVETVEAVGQFWVQGRFEGEMFGMPFHGRAVMGYDPWKEEYVSTWVDSFSPAMITLRGRREGDEMVLEGPGVDPGTGNPVRYRTVETIGDTTRQFAMYIQGPDDWIKLFDMLYSKRG